MTNNNEIENNIEPQPEIRDACSCTTCDSLCCFARRDKAFSCLCEQCKSSKINIYYTSEKVYRNESLSRTSNIIADFTKSVSTSMCGNVTSVNKILFKPEYSDLEKNLKDRLEKIIKSELALNELVTKDHNEETDSDKNIEPPGVRLSAQIMNLSCKDFKQTLGCNRSDTSYKVSKLSKYDIFQKIKEVYKACSCKVCECIVGKSTRNELCNCKPCECSDCLSYFGKLQASQTGKTFKDVCNCKQYDEKFAGMANKINDNKHCNCTPCDCIECDDYIVKPCHCESCQCVECKSKLTHRPASIIVAPVDNYQRNLCQCSPCECIECAHGYGMPSNLRHEISTGRNRQRLAQCHCKVCQNEACVPDGFSSCQCERQNKVMNEPVERDGHNYDIRTVLLENPTYRNYKNNRHDTIAMFAAVSNNIPNQKTEAKRCTCEECECLACSYKEDVINAIKSSQLFTPTSLQTDKKSTMNTRTETCKSQPCEYQICNKLKGNQSHRDKECLCEICNCVNCRRRKSSTITRQSSKSAKDDCKFRPCECSNCEQINKLKRQRTCMICNRCLHYKNLTSTSKSVSASQNTSLSNRDSTFKIKTLQESLSVYRAFPTLDFPQQTMRPKTIPHNYGTIRQASMTDFKPKKVKCPPVCPKTCDTLKCDAYTQYKNYCKGVSTTYSMEFKASGSYLSDSYFIKTNSKTSLYFKDNGSVTPVSGHENKSCESSCNSSGYDYPDYLVQFPKSTVETCLKDVMKLSLDKNIKFDRIKVLPNTEYIRKRYSNSTPNEITISGNHNLSQGYEGTTKHKKYYKPLHTQRSSHRRGRRNFYNDDGANLPMKKSHSKKISTCGRNFYINKQPCVPCIPCFPPDTPMEDVIIYITNNQTTQTEDHGSLHYKKSNSLIQIDKYERNNSRNLQAERNLKEFQISRNIYEHNILHQEPSAIQTEQLMEYSDTSAFGNLPKSYDFSKMDEDYIRLQKTLRDAKKFSSDLLKLLEKYEKDNREFESISEKLKVLHKGVRDNNVIKTREINDTKNPILNENTHKSQHLNETEYELRQIHQENPSIQENISLPLLPKQIGNAKSGEITKILHQNVNKDHNKTEGLSLLPDESCHKNRAIPNKRYDILDQEVSNTFKDINIYNNHKIRSNKRAHRSFSRLTKRTLIVSKKISVKNIAKKDPQPAVMTSATTETLNSLVLQTVVKNKKVTSRSMNTTELGHSIKINKAPDNKIMELKKVMRILDAMFRRKPETSVSTSITKMQQKRSEKENWVLEGCTAMQTQDIEGRKPWPILKKNYNLDVKASAKNREVCIFPSLELEVKEAVQSISLQTREKHEPRKHFVKSLSHREIMTNKHTVETGNMAGTTTQPQPVTEESGVRKDNSNISRKSKLELELKDPPKARFLQANLQKVANIDKEIFCDHFIYSTAQNIERQIKDLLNLSVLQPIMKKLLNCDNPLNTIDTENLMPRIESSKSSCEALKASFLGLRRVSDHTVLVKWNLPREVTDVIGYELLVDGRAVQKIFSPSKCMAVITCLPHMDKIVLTIRTITPALAQAGHFPAASIIYHPRIK